MEGVDVEELVFIMKQGGRRGSGGRWTSLESTSAPVETEELRAQPSPVTSDQAPFSWYRPYLTASPMSPSPSVTG